jgi:hypothetical protein
MEEVRAQLRALIDQPLPRHERTVRWRKLLDELSDLRDKLGDGTAAS